MCYADKNPNGHITTLTGQSYVLTNIVNFPAVPNCHFVIQLGFPCVYDCNWYRIDRTVLLAKFFRIPQSGEEISE